MTVRIDRSQYTSSPHGSGRQLMSLGRVMLKRIPADPKPHVQAAAAQLGAMLDKTQGIMAERIRNYGPGVALMDREDDGYVDSVLKISRTRLEDWGILLRATAGRIAASKPANDATEARKRAKAELAGRVHAQLFGTELDATRAPYAEQAEYMLMLERIIDEQGLAEPLRELIGELHYDNLRDSITLYTKMVERRQSGDGGSEASLRELRVELQQAIQNYMLALLVSIRDDDPDSVAEIRRALGPVDAFRATFGRRSSATGEDEGAAEGAAGAAELDDPSVADELLAEQRSLDAEIGFVEGDARSGVS